METSQQGHDRPPPLLPAPEPGIYPCVPPERYAQWDALAARHVSPILRSPAHLREALAHRPDGAAARLGQLTHTLVFEPERFLDLFAVRPDSYRDDKGRLKPWNACANVCREMLAQLSAGGRPVVAPETYRKAVRVRRAVLDHRLAGRMLADGEPTICIVWKDPASGTTCKARLDWVRRGKEITDLKTTSDAGPAAMSRQTARYDYHVQAAMYADGWRTLSGEDLPVKFIAAETARPWCVAVYGPVEPASLRAGRERYLHAAGLYRKCRRWGRWPGYSGRIQPIGLPGDTKEAIHDAAS